jgi:hypothetical protein
MGGGHVVHRLRIVRERAPAGGGLQCRLSVAVLKEQLAKLAEHRGSWSAFQLSMQFPKSLLLVQLAGELGKTLEFRTLRVQLQAFAADAKYVRRLPQRGVLFGERHVVGRASVAAKRTNSAPDPTTTRGEHREQ